MKKIRRQKVKDEAQTALFKRSSSYHAVNTFNGGYKNQSVYDRSGTSHCLFSNKYKTHKYSVGRAVDCWMLNCWCITWPVGFKRLTLCLYFLLTYRFIKNYDSTLLSQTQPRNFNATRYHSKKPLHKNSKLKFIFVWITNVINFSKICVE